MSSWAKPPASPPQYDIRIEFFLYCMFFLEISRYISHLIVEISSVQNDSPKFNFSQNSSPASSSSYQQNSVVTEKDKNYFEEEKDEDGEVSSDDEKEKKKDGEFLSDGEQEEEDREVLSDISDKTHSHSTFKSKIKDLKYDNRILHQKLDAILGKMYLFIFCSNLIIFLRRPFQQK